MKNWQNVTKCFPIERNSERKMKNWLSPICSSCTWPCGCKWTWQAGGLSIYFFCLQNNSEACLGGTNRIWSPWFSLWSRLCSFHGRKKHFDALVGQPTYFFSTPYFFSALRWKQFWREKEQRIFSATCSVERSSWSHNSTYLYFCIGT